MSTGNIVGTIAAAATLYVTGGNFQAAAVAYQVGNAVGDRLDPPKGPTTEGPRLSDLTVQSSTYSQFIPRTYGTVGLHGNVFWLENNRLKEVVRKKKSGGKGGGSVSTVKTYTYFATFAVGLCEGPIAGVRRIWVGPDLVYDAGSDDIGTIISSNTASSKFTIYLGTDTQQPDPRIQAEMGVANCPAYRGLAYVVVKDLALADYGNSVAGAQIKVEVVNSAAFSVELISSNATDYDITQTNPSFQPRVFHATTERLSFYSPDWSIDYPASSTMGHYELAYGSFVDRPKINVTKPPGTNQAAFIPPFGSSDVPTDYFVGSNSVIHGTTLQFIAGIGHFVKRSGTTVATSTASAPGATYIYDGLTTISIPLGFDMVAYSPSMGIYLASGANIYRYDETLTLVAGSPSSPFTVVDSGSEGFCDGGDCILAIKRTGEVYKVDYSLASYQYAFTLPSFAAVASGTMYEFSNGILIRAYKNSSTSELSVDFFNVARLTDQQVPLSTIVAKEAARSNLIKPSDIVTTGLVDSVTGFKVTTIGSIRNAIEPLRGAWPFDVVQSGYKIVATSRGSASVVTIPTGELAIDTQLTESREMDSQLPQNVTVKYIDRDRDYDGNEQRAQRDNTDAVNSLIVELPVVLSASQAAQVADKLIRIYALEKSDFAFTLPAPYRYLEPGDVVTIATDDADYVLRLVSVNHTADGRLECAGRPSSASTYTSIAPGDGGQTGSAVIPLAGATIGILIDCPVIDEGLQNSPGFAVGFNGYSAGWPGGILYRTNDNGQVWEDLQALNGRATAGFASTTIGEHAGNLILRAGSLTVSLINGTLESVTESQMLNGANIAAYGVNGRWEIIRFQNATLNGDGTYTLDTFWRGDRGTEWATGLHAAGDYFMLMTDPDLAFVGMPTDSIGQPRDYRAITSGADIDSATSSAFTYAGVNLETLSGVLPVGRRSAGDLTVTWQRRTRVGGAWRDFVDASLGESIEAYEVDIMQGATVKRTITASTPSVLYTSAQQVTDFGSQQASVVVNIYQMSSVVGRGYPLGATL